jgi:hypothetical protein
MTKTFDNLGKAITVSFTKVFLDPNNPRIAPGGKTRYDHPDEIFNDQLQKDLTTKFYTAYKAGDLEDAIVVQGWVPIDPIIVWEHPDRPDHHIVVEGNTRVSVLRSIRGARLERERAKLEKFNKGGKVPPEELKQQRQLVAQLEGIAKDTDKLVVYPVKAATLQELEEKLPRLLGVRHIMHARPWSPYATNLYILSLYERVFHEQHGEEEALRLEQHLIARVASMVSLGETKTRRNLQAASAFSHFKRHYEDQLPEGESFSDGDHYFFENILQNKYAQEQFGFSKDRLYLSDESERALFHWAFSQPRKDDENKNPNTFYKAENIRAWNEMSKYDAENGTGFASQFDVSNPEKAAKSFRLVEAEYLHQKARQTPLNTLQALLEALKDLKGETMITQSNFLKPTLQEIASLTEHYLRMMEADSAA